MADSLDQPDVVAVGDEPIPRALRKRAASLLEAGELVVLPTETLYGVAARADDPGAPARLAELVGTSSPHPWTWHVARREAVDRFPHLRPLVRRLVERYWPGPLTLVLQGVPAGLESVAEDGWCALRLPAHRAAQSLIEEVPFPLVVTSVGGDVASVRERFPQAALVLDGGPSRLAEASGIVRLGPGEFSILRDGLLQPEELRRTAGRRIAFCCTGNTCRSPMAEGLARGWLTERLGIAGSLTLADFGFEVRSMGVFASPGAPASTHAVEILARRGLDLSQHRATLAEAGLVAQQDEVYCLTRSHLEALVQSLPPGQAKHVQLLDPEGRDVPDPIGGSLADYQSCAELILRAIEVRAAHWA